MVPPRSEIRPLRRLALRGCSSGRRGIWMLAMAPLALPAAADSLGLPATYSRSIVIADSGQGVRVTRFEVATRSAGSKVRVSVRVVAASLAGTRGLVIAVGPCTAGPVTSPLCKPTASARLRIGRAPAQAIRSFLVARPASSPDALRVTLTKAGQPVPFLRERVGGGGGTAEILLNGGTWRYRQGTWWGMVATPPTGVALDRVWFNSRRYEWRATSQGGGVVSTKIGYELERPRWDFTNTMRAGVPFSFHRTPSAPAQSRRLTPRVLAFTADIGRDRLFALRVPLAAWRGH